MNAKLSFIPICCAALIVAACAKTEPPTGNTTPAKLPVSLNEVMVALVNHSADPIWIAEHNAPKDDKGWRELERNAMQLQVAGALLGIPGTGPKDEEWTSRQEWRGFAAALSKAGEAAVSAVRSRDHALILQSGNEIVEICEGCHKVFKPDLPTMKMFGELSPHEGSNGEKK